MVSELSIIFIITPNPSPPDGHCAGGTHPTGMHSCYLEQSLNGSSSDQFSMNRISLLCNRYMQLIKNEFLGKAFPLFCFSNVSGGYRIS